MDIPGGLPVPESAVSENAHGSEETSPDHSELVKQHLTGGGGGKPASDSSGTLGLKGMVQLFGPQAVAQSVSQQLGFTETSPVEQQRQQQENARIERQNQQRRQTFEAWKQRREAEAEQVRSSNVQQKQHILSLNTPLPKNTVVHTRSEADKSESTLLDHVRRDTLVARENRAKATMSAGPKGQQKGPNMEGGGEQARSNMFDRMTTGQSEKPKSKSSIADHELPLGE